MGVAILFPGLTVVVIVVALVIIALVFGISQNTGGNNDKNKTGICSKCGYSYNPKKSLAPEKELCPKCLKDLDN